MNIAAMISSRFADNPGFLERIELFISNVPSLIVLAMCFFLVLRFKASVLKNPYIYIAILLLSLTPTLIRWAGGYPYDSPIALLSWIFDFGFLVWMQFYLGRSLWRGLSLSESLSAGTGILICLSVGFIVFGLHQFIGPPSLGVSLGLVLLISICFTKSMVFGDAVNPFKDAIQTYGFRLVLFGLVIVTVPILPYLFSPSPPDADITAMKEIMGFIFQGQNLAHVIPGPLGEFYDIRYPWGLPGISWIWGHVLHMGASEALTLAWIFAWAFLVMNIATLTRHLHVSIWVAVLFALNATFTGFYGFDGGQVQEMLAYGLGIGMILQLLKGRYLLGSILLAASMITQPIVAIPFCFVWGFDALRFFWNLTQGKDRFNFDKLMGAVVVLLGLAFLASLSLGKSEFQSQPDMLLSALKVSDFFRNILTWLNYDTFCLWIFCFAIALPWFTQFRNEKRYDFAVIGLWFLGANVINGLFGSTEQFHFTATFQSGFSVGAIWVIAIGIAYQYLDERVGVRWKKWQPASFIVIWIFCVAPKLIWVPSSVFITHSDI